MGKRLKEKYAYKISRHRYHPYSSKFLAINGARKVFECRICSTVYRHKSALQNHIKSVHFDVLSSSDASDEEYRKETTEEEEQSDSSGSTDILTEPDFSEYEKDSRSEYSSDSEEDLPRRHNKVKKSLSEPPPLQQQQQQNSEIHHCVHCSFWTRDERKLASHLLGQHGLPRVVLRRLPLKPIIKLKSLTNELQLLTRSCKPSNKVNTEIPVVVEISDEDDTSENSTRRKERFVSRRQLAGTDDEKKIIPTESTHHCILKTCSFLTECEKELAWHNVHCHDLPRVIVQRKGHPKDLKDSDTSEDSVDEEDDSDMEPHYEDAMENLQKEDRCRVM